MNMKISLIDNDYVVRAKTDLVQNGPDDPFRKFVKQIKEELVTGQTEFLEIEGSEIDPFIFEISQIES